MGIIDTTVIVIYLGILGYLGLYFSRRQTTLEGYFLAARSLPGWVVGFSIMGTMIGSITFIGHPGEVFKTNMWALTGHLASPVVMIFISIYMVSFYRNTIRMTVYHYLEKRFSYPMRAYASAMFVVGHVLHLSITFYFLAVAFAYMSGWDVWWVILIVGLATVIYTMVGGIEAVVWSDVIQGNLLIFGGLFCLGVLLFSPDIGPTEIIVRAWNGGKFSLGNWDFSWYEKNQWFFVVGGILGAIGGLAFDQNAVQRYLLAKSDEEAAKAAYMGSVVCIPIWILFMVIGALTWAFYELSTEQLPADVLEQKDFIMPYFIKTQFPVGFIGLVMAALLGAAMSSIDSTLNAISSVTVNDFYIKFRPNSKDKDRLILGKLMVAFFGISSIVVAQRWIGLKSVIETSMIVGSVIGGGGLGLFSLGLLFRWTTVRGVAIGIVSSIIFSAWATFTRINLPGMETPLFDLGRFNYTLHPLLIGLFSHCVIMVVGMLVSILAGGPRTDTWGLTIWDAISEHRKKSVNKH